MIRAPLFCLSTGNPVSDLAFTSDLYFRPGAPKAVPRHVTTIHPYTYYWGVLLLLTHAASIRSEKRMAVSPDVSPYKGPPGPIDPSTN